MKRQRNSNGTYKKTHGLRSHPMYNRWKNMLSRCNDPDSKDYPYYGGRGISVCKEWQDIKNFVEWAENHKTYDPNLTLDRIDNDGDYEPSNCHFVNWVKQSENSRQSKLNIKLAQDIRGKAYPRNYARYEELAKEYNVSFGTIVSVVTNKVWKTD